jgi:uncharacterized membrane protein YjjB (DUF3815 family)
MSKWIPNRKYLSGGLSGVAAYFVATLLDVPAELAMQIAAALAAGVAYVVPDSVGDILKRVDQTIVDLAREQSKAK